MTSHYIPDRRGMAEFLQSDMLSRSFEEIGRRVQTHAELIAPVGGSGDPHRGRYKAAFSTDVHKFGGYKHDRVELVLRNSSPEAFYVEFGTSDQEAHHIVLRAAVEGTRL